MPSLQFDIGEKKRAVARYIGEIRAELQRAFVSERTERKLTQQAIATKLGVNRSVVNRQLMGLENMTSRSVAELFWAMGWEPDFSAKKIDEAAGNYFITPDASPKPMIKKTPTRTTSHAVLELR